MGSRLKEGATGQSAILAGVKDTASAMGSGDMDVLATPAMVAVAENAAMKAVAPFMGEGETTVGGFIGMSHLKPTAVGDTVTARATLTGIEGRKLTFSVEAFDSGGKIGEGNHVRYVVDRKRFVSKL